MDRRFAYHIMKGGLEMRVQSARHVFEEPITGVDPDEVLNKLDEYLQRDKGGRTIEDNRYPLSFLPALLAQAELAEFSEQRVREMTRVDLTRFIPSELAYSYEGLTA